MNIPVVNLKKQYQIYHRDIDKAIKSVLDSTHFILGEEVDRFEEEFAKFCETKYCVGLDNGISALELGMRALGIGPGDEVITPVNSFIASSAAISFTGAKPVLVDCLPDTYNIDPEKIEKAINKKTKAIMPVHLYGQIADMDSIMAIAKKKDLFIIEDACQAHGAVYKGKKAGSLGDLSAFSFYPGKNLGAYGDAGALVTSKKEIAEKVRMMRNYGQKEKYHHLSLAWNRRLDSIQAAVLRVKLRHLPFWNQKRKEHALLYNELLNNTKVITPFEIKNVVSIYHIYCLRVEKREKLQQYLQNKGIMTGIHYPIPIHLQKAYCDLGYKKGDFPIAEKLSKEILSLPMYPELTKEEIKYISRNIHMFYKT